MKVRGLILEHRNVVDSDYRHDDEAQDRAGKAKAIAMVLGAVLAVPALFWLLYCAGIR